MVSAEVHSARIYELTNDQKNFWVLYEVITFQAKPVFVATLLLAEESVPNTTIFPRKRKLSSQTKLLIRPRDVRRRQFYRSKDPFLKTVVEVLDNNVLLIK